MPMYEYQCKKCETLMIKTFSIKDYPKSIKCEECGEEAPKIISSCSFQLVGLGWTNSHGEI